MNFGSISKVVGQNASRGLLHLKKHSPQILTGVGVLGSVASTVLACRATLKLEPVVEEFEKGKRYANAQKEDIGRIHPTTKKPVYTEKQYRRDMSYIHASFVLKTTKLYLPSILLGAGAIVCTISAQNIMQQRNLALAAAYGALDKAYTNYRKRVEAELGPDKEREIHYDLEKVRVDDTEKGTVEEVLRPRNKNHQVSAYSKWFGETNPNFQKNPTYNRMFIETQERWANQKLMADKHLFLNDVYRQLGLPDTSAGAVVGWVIDKGTEGDGYVSFNIYDGYDEKKRDFVNGFEDAILLDFNVDGTVYDLIG